MFSIPSEIEYSVSATGCPNETVVHRGGTPPKGESINFQGDRAPTCPWKF